ncbi:MAG: hypothetical protein ACR2NP_09000 [Pirellulaceae bacterium]
MSESRHKPPADGMEKNTKAPLSGWGKLGIALILLSGVFFFSMFAVPWLPISGSQKVILGGALFAGVQIAWWTGAALAGPTVVGAIRSRLPGTRRSKKPDDGAGGDRGS